VFEQVTGLVQPGHIWLIGLDCIRNYGPGLELCFDQGDSLLGDLLRFRGDDRQRVPHVADTFSNPNHDRPVEDHQSVVVLGRDVVSG